MPSTSVQITSSSASTTCAMIAPEKSELLRPSVVMRPSGVAPMKPVTTGTMASARSGTRTSRPRRLVCSRFGLASRNVSQVRTKSDEETGTAATPERSNAAANNRAAKRSPNEARWPKHSRGLELREEDRARENRVHRKRDRALRHRAPAGRERLGEVAKLLRLRRARAGSYARRGAAQWQGDGRSRPSWRRPPRQPATYVQRNARVRRRAPCARHPTTKSRQI